MAFVLVQPRFAARLVLEMLDRVGEIERAPVEPRLSQRLVEPLARRPDERLAGQVFLRAGLLADQHRCRIGRILAEHGTVGVAPQRAVPAFRGLAAQCRQAARGHVFDRFRQRNYGLIESSNHAQQPQHEDDEQDETDTSGWAIAPGAAVAPGWQRTDQQQDEDDDQQQ